MHKNHFGFKELQFLGDVVSFQGVRLGPDKIAAVTVFLAPLDKKVVRCFPGLCAYYRRFIAFLSCIVSASVN